MSRASVPRRSTKPAWTPFARATLIQPDPRVVERTAQQHGIALEEAQAAFRRDATEYECFKNSRYQVLVRRELHLVQDWPPIIHLSIRRLDREPVHDWRDLQRIKNELVGPEHEAVELYPAESRLVDAANQAHLWVFAVPLPRARFPFGFDHGREVMEGGNGKSKQRPFEEGTGPW